MKIITSPAFFSKSKGFTLLEVMVSLLLFSFTLLSLDALMVTALHKQNQQYFLQVAINQLYNLKQELNVTKTPDLSQWQAENSKLLPRGWGRLANKGKAYQFEITWEPHQKLVLPYA